MPGRSDNSRAEAARIIARWLRTENFPDRSLEDVTANRAFVTQMVYGAARQRRALEWVIARLSNRRPAKEAIPYLLVGLYQVLMMDDVAPHAAVSETVNAVAEHAEYAAKFVNAVLRRALREKDEIGSALARQPVGVRESHPDLLVERWTDTFGEARALSLCEWNNGTPDITISANSLRTDTPSLSRILSSAGIDARPHPAAPDNCLVLPHGVRIPDLPGFADGLFSVRDPSTMTAVALLDPRPGERILDACAAPGGKTALIAEQMRGRGSLVAMDLHADRLPRLHENVRRLGLTGITVAQGDATAGPGDAADGKPFDRILLDVPCTNTGVLRRRPDARWRFSLDRLDALTRLQRRMLDSAAACLTPGGTLVYSTCSLEPEEGETLIASWLGDNAEFERGSTASRFPPEAGTDGIYAAVLRRNATR